MRALRGLFCAGVAFLAAWALSACGGAGGSSVASVPGAHPVPGRVNVVQTPAPSNDLNVAYMTQSANSATGSIIPGATSAVLVGISANTSVIAGTAGNSVGQAAIAVALSGQAPAAAQRRSAVARVDHPAAIAIALPELRPVSGPARDRALQAALQPAGSFAAAPGRRRLSTLPTNVGASAALWAQDATNGQGNGAYVAVPATLAAVTAHGYIWIDASLPMVLGDAASVSAIGADFETAYASDSARFASPNYAASAGGLRTQYATCDAGGNPLPATSPVFISNADAHINVFVINPSSLGSGVGGYFDSANFYAQSVLNCSAQGRRFRSNQAPFIYVGWNTANTSAFELQEDVLRGAAHELQHLISFVNHVILASGPNATSEDTWLNEGLSMLAQDFAVNAAFPSQATDVADAGVRAHNYLLDPQNVSLTGFIGSSGGVLHYNCSSCYGAAYLFSRYLYDRFGDAFTHAIDGAGASVSTANLQAASGRQAAMLLGDFAVALENSGTGNSSDPRFNLRALNLRGTVHDQFGGSVTFNGPAILATLQPGASATYLNYLGANFYIALSGAGGDSVTVRDQSNGAYALAGAIWQR